MNKGKLKTILRSPWTRLMLVLFGIAFIFAIWAIISVCLDSAIVPGPTKVMTRFFIMLGEKDTYLAIGATLLRVIFAFAISFLFSFVLGLLAGLINPLKIFLKPVMMVLKTIPTAALVFAFFVYFRNDVTLFLVIFLVMFPILYEAVSNGVANIDENILNALKVDGGIGAPKSIFKVIIPCASPYIILGIIQVLGLGMKVGIMAEILIGERTIPGLGVNIIGAYIDGVAVDIFANTIYAILVISLIDFLFFLFSKQIKKNKM